MSDSGYPDNTSSLSELERIELVKSDNIRRWGQIILSFILIGFALGFLAWYVLLKADDAFLNYVAVGMLSLIFGGIGAALAIYGLGRTVGRGGSGGSSPAPAPPAPAPPVITNPTDTDFELAIAMSKRDPKYEWTTGNGQWARENTLAWIDSNIKRLTNELDRSNDELAKWEATPMPDAFKAAKEMFINGIKNEIAKTKAQLDEKVRYKNELMSRWTWLR